MKFFKALSKAILSSTLFCYACGQDPCPTDDGMGYSYSHARHGDFCWLDIRFTPENPIEQVIYPQVKQAFQTSEHDRSTGLFTVTLLNGFDTTIIYTKTVNGDMDTARIRAEKAIAYDDCDEAWQLNFSNVSLVSSTLASVSFRFDRYLFHAELDILKP